MRLACAIACGLLVVLALAAACGDDSGGPSGPYTETLRFTRAGHDVTLNVEVADEPQERTQGLMNRKSMPEDAGMLFVWPDDTESGFWMRDTVIPLSIAFVTAGGVIIDIQDMEPLSEEFVHAPRPYRYAVEVNQGWFGDNDVRVGDVLQLPVGIGP
ncbi:MAG TPA: DUF192 domain-containing protein [Dehalococcoidia bacterium]